MFILGFFLTSNLFAQKNVFDSLYTIAENAKSDYAKSYAYDEASRAILRYNPDSALVVAKLGLAYAKKSGNDTITADSYNSLGVIFRLLSNYSEAIESLKKSVKHAANVDAKRQIVNAQSALGLVYNEQGNFSAALEIYYEILLGSKNRSDTASIARVTNNVANIYFEQKLFNKALENYQEAYHYAVAMNHEFGQCLLLGNIGSAYFKLKNYDLALKHYEESFKISLKIDDEEGVGISYVNFASVYFEQKKYKKALEYQKKALLIKEKLGDIHGQSIVLNELGKIYQTQGDVQKGIFYSKGALNLATDIGAKELERDANEALYKMYELTDEKKLAYHHFKNHIYLRDSLINEKTQKEDIRNELNFQFKKQHFTDSLEHVKVEEVAAQKLKNEQVKTASQKKLTYTFIIAFLVMMVSAIFIYKEYKAKKQAHQTILSQKKEVEHQSAIIHEKNREILDSITYAKRIQNAILPPQKVVKEYLQESFIFYKPKDIVAGDFYWMEQKDGKILFAAADCTGHGVPGAMVSVVCNNGLNRSVREYKLTDPGKILDKTREIVVQEFEKSEDEVKDGMDIALCSIEGNTLQYAGAHNPLWIIRNGELLETKANKQPIGKFDNPEPYTTHTIALQKGDSIYIFSDGYIDQFGGEKGKKFKSRAFKELLLSNQEKSMEGQKQIIDAAFENWRGDLEQLDDVCVIGVRI